MRKTTGEDAVSVAATADIAQWAPVCVPHRIHMIAIALNATPGDAGVVKFDLRPTVGSDTNRTDGTVGIINLATSHTFTAGSAQPVIYEELDEPFVVYPGQEVIAQVTDASANATAVHIGLWVEPVYERPGNIVDLSDATTMTATT
jgi:hypothetical protein